MLQATTATRARRSRAVTRPHAACPAPDSDDIHTQSGRRSGCVHSRAVSNASRCSSSGHAIAPPTPPSSRAARRRAPTTAATAAPSRDDVEQKPGLVIRDGKACASSWKCCDEARRQPLGHERFMSSVTQRERRQAAAPARRAAACGGGFCSPEQDRDPGHDRQDQRRRAPRPAHAAKAAAAPRRRPAAARWPSAAPGRRSAGRSRGRAAAAVMARPASQ